MRNHVVVSVRDSFVSVDAHGIVCPGLTAPAKATQLQWHCGSGYLVLDDGTQQYLEGDDDYADAVAPFVVAWEQELVRQNAGMAEAEAQSLEWYNTPEARAERLRTERDRRMAATDYMMLPDAPQDAAQREAVAAYRQALRDMPAQKGFPWAGGGPNDAACPWPVLDLTSGGHEA